MLGKVGITVRKEKTKKKVVRRFNELSNKLNCLCKTRTSSIQEDFTVKWLFIKVEPSSDLPLKEWIEHLVNKGWRNSLSHIPAQERRSEAYLAWWYSSDHHLRKLKNTKKLLIEPRSFISEYWGRDNLTLKFYIYHFQ